MSLLLLFSRRCFTPSTKPFSKLAVTTRSSSSGTRVFSSSSREYSGSFSSSSLPGRQDTAMPHAESQEAPRRLVLCFDGTGNTFSGSTADTNIVKLYDKLDRNDDNQFHYYQPGIGTYDIGGGSLNKSFIGSIRSKISRTVDQGIATSFDAHVIAGYRFLMQYYGKGDKIYMFGFSRGAFTARFLARMVGTVGLLSKGNEEMVPFAYQLYQDYEQGNVKLEEETGKATNGADALLPDDLSDSPAAESASRETVDEMQLKRNKLRAFTNTFCRREPVMSADGVQVYEAGTPVYKGVKVFFLGIFDCVGSVAVLENPFARNQHPVSVVGTSQHVRHAVAVDERRVKFKAALLAQDLHHAGAERQSAKEVWFPGNHGDVGGGWPAPEPGQKPTWWAFFKGIFTTSKPKDPPKNVSEDPYQMSDIPLSWMIEELERIGEEEPEAALKWNEHLAGFKHNFQKKKDQALNAAKHDTMRVRGGSSLFMVIFWNILDCLPFMPRKELENGNWVRRVLMPNFGDTRDIPLIADLHDSLYWRLTKMADYKPSNNHGGRLPPCLKPGDLEPSESNYKTPSKDHKLWSFKARPKTTNGY